jgi:aspartate carbamoyltransferase catalytic subunit
MAWRRKDLLGIRELEPSEITLIVDTAASLREISEREIKKVPTLRGKTVVNLFYEPSTRTRTSFEIAGKWLSADVVNFSASTSSLGKGETLLDTARNIAAMSPDVVVVRHSASGAAELLARTLHCGVVNAGDGAHEHPTQALLDLLTIRERKRHLDGLHVAIVGDVAHSRVARSNIYGMRKLGMTVTVAGPPTLIPPHVQELGVKVSHRLEDAIRDVDVIMMLRLQHERMAAGLIPSLREYARYWGLTLDRLRASARPDVLIMHPGPVNRGIELSPEVADGPYSVILEQTSNGVAVRMAVLFLLAGAKAAQEPRVERGGPS